MAPGATDTDLLLDRAADGDGEARQRLLDRHRDRLLRMVAVRLDPRLAARVDPSDVVQETLMHADRQFNGYLRDRPLPFYPWLRRIAWERLVKCHVRHTRRRRDVGLERRPPRLSDASAHELIDGLIASGASPSEILARRELIDRARSALQRLRERDREVLVLRYLEHLSTADTAAVLGITPGAVKLRHLRALERLREMIAEDDR